MTEDCTTRANTSIELVIDRGHDTIQRMRMQLDDEIARPAREAAQAIGISFDEFVTRAVVAALADRRRELVASVQRDRQQYSALLEYLGTH
jgi:hypothetical protein